MTNDVAVFLDLDNLVIGAKQANLTFDINLVLDQIKKITSGRIVLRHAYGAGRQSQGQLQELAQAGFVVQSATRINNFSKNLADMQIAVNAMDTLVDGHQYNTYVLMSGDRDFTPLVQSLRKRGKCVIGVGIRHTTSRSLVELCDKYIFYEDLIPATDLTGSELEQLVRQTCAALLQEGGRVRASKFRQHMITASDGRFSKKSYTEGSFSKFLLRYPHLLELEREESTTFVRRPDVENESQPLSARYRSALKKQRLRIVPPQQRFALLHALITLLSDQSGQSWHQVQDMLFGQLSTREDMDISKSMVNAMLLVARRAGIIRTLRGKSLASAPVMLEIDGQRAFQEAVLKVDQTYLTSILNLPDPFDFSEAALALYDSVDYVPYLRRIVKI